MWAATEQLRRDLAYAARMAARNRGFTTAAILTLALGTGAATATFSIVDAIVFRPLPYAAVDRLVKIWGSSAADPLDNMSLADFVDISERRGVFEQVAADDGTGFKVEYRGVSHDALGGIVTAEWLSTLGVRPALGRGFLPEEFQPGRDDVPDPDRCILAPPLCRGRRRRGADAQRRRRAVHDSRRAAAQRSALQRGLSQAAGGRVVSGRARASRSRRVRPAPAGCHARGGPGGTGRPWPADRGGLSIDERQPPVQGHPAGQVPTRRWTHPPAAGCC